MADATLPGTYRQQLIWFQARIQAWIDNAALLQLSTEQVSELFALLQLAQTKLDELEASRASSKIATANFRTAMENVLKKGREYIKSIKVTAALADDNEILDIAGIPVPAEPRELKQPAAPVGVDGTINGDGTVTVKWDIPSRGAWDGKVYFQIVRELLLSSTGEETSGQQLIGTSHDRDFTDLNVPTGWRKAEYSIIARRNGFSSTASKPGVVTFGNVFSGGSTMNTAGETNIAEAA